MKPYDSEFVEDVEELLEQVVLEEATSAIWKTFESALNQLDPESRQLLEAHWEGATASKLSETTKLPEPQVQMWLKRIKRELQQNVRKELRIKQ
jgi:DNA-directed RNA polymerase specialized sigma24 family protein